MTADVTAARMTESPEDTDARVELRPLETLMSPTSSEPATDLDIVDDARFSVVPLSAASSDTPDEMTPIEETVDITAGLNESRQPQSEANGHGAENGGGSTPSRNGAQFLLARLEHQKERSDTLPARSSLDVQKDLERVQQTGDAEASTIDWDFWGEVVADYQTYAADHSEQLARAIEAGIPSPLRGLIWQQMCASKDPALEQLYAQYLKETSPHERAIKRDLGRTFPNHAFFTDGSGVGQGNLSNVLKAYSLHDPEVGYCQGLPFVVAVLLLNMPDEEAFCVLVRLMYSYDLRGHFLPEMPSLQLRMFQFDRLLEELLPVLHVHFLRQGVKSSMFCSQWFLTLFSYRWPLPIVYRIWDNCLASGIEAIFGFSIALLLKNEEALLNLKFDQILDFLKSKILDCYTVKREPTEEDPSTEGYLVDEFVMDAFRTRITPFMLDAYAREYADLLQAREAHAAEMDSLRNANRSLTAQVKKLEDSLAQLDREHCDIVKELVMQRITNEELETELVRYKLL
ncbi:RabGAP/TBC [Exidia glandulosa HHB12029]|uniref:RabGAP/TBC n=1 Tax=Exidia glandulosa HHB12029 TaxID=1314781 RepID=A0A165JP37_EXIGL|nr:RabGAP/TBC [Exidia glandulosa HHB12029]